MGKTGKPTGNVRIIGGEWRGRRLRIPPGTGVQPTPDRIRETVFNWLGPRIAGMRCLDLYAGTGAFGFEALSRGAREVVMVERDATLFAALEEAAARFGTDRVRLLRGDAAALLGLRSASGALPDGAYDFVVLDPPYRDAIGPLLAAVVERLAEEGVIYVERPAMAGLPEPPGLRWHRRGRAGNVEYGLAVRG